MRSRLLPLFVGCWLLGCGSDGPEPPPNPLATVSGFCVEWAKVACNSEVVDACQARDEEACRDTQEEFCLDLVPSSGYEATHAKACLRAVQNAYADAELTAKELLTVRALRGDCSKLIRGSADEGDSCDEDSDCDTTKGYACVRRPDGGTCQIPEEVGAGRSCRAENAVCEEDFYCDGSNCVERLPEDEACTHSSECASDLRCQAVANGEGGSSSSGDGDGMCVERAANTDPCSSHDDCRSGFCLMSDSGSDGECLSLIVLGRAEPLCAELK